MHPLLILSPLLGTPENGYVAISPKFGPLRVMSPLVIFPPFLLDPQTAGGM